MANPWVKHWEIVGTSGKKYKVSQREDLSYGCECPAWKFQHAPRKDCQHIMQVLLSEGKSSSSKISMTKITNQQDKVITRIITFDDV